jgi:iron complex transport system substrate-binding protein
MVSKESDGRDRPSGIDRRRLIAGGVAALLSTRALGANPARVVTAGSDVTETVAALAGIEVIKGVDVTSRTPDAVTKLPSVGYLRQISVEGILSLDPDLLIAHEDLGPSGALQQLRSTGLTVELIGGPPSGEGIGTKVARIGTVLGRPAEATALWQKVAAEMTDLARRVEGVAARPRIAFIRSSDGGVILAAGRIPSVDAAFALAGGVNAFDFPVFQPVSKEALASAPPDFLVTSPSSVERAGGLAAFLAVAGLTAAFDGQPDRIVLLETTRLFAFGPAGPGEIATLARRIHPERFAAAAAP